MGTLTAVGFILAIAAVGETVTSAPNVNASAVVAAEFVGQTF